MQQPPSRRSESSCGSDLTFRQRADDGGTEESSPKPRPTQAVPYVELDIEINLPNPAMASLVDDMPAGLNIAELWTELQNPHSTLRLGIKDKLQKLILAQRIPPPLPDPEPRTWDDPDPPKPHTVPRALGLREMPKSTGGAYMMKGFTPAEAPFAGGHKYNFTGTVDVTSKGCGLPAPYQPFRDDNEQPYGREKPSLENPVGARRLPPEHVAPRSFPPAGAADRPATPQQMQRVFSLVRVGPRPSSGASSEMYRLPP